MGFWDEVELVEMRDLGSGHRTLVGEVEIVEGFGLGEPGRADAVLASMCFAGGHFFGEDLYQQLEGIPPLSAGCLSHVWSDLADAGHLESSGEQRPLRW